MGVPPMTIPMGKHRRNMACGGDEMSVELCVYLRNDRLPTHEEWQSAISEENLKLTLDAVDLRNFDGFLPCRLDAIECGFEFDFGPLEDQDEELGNEISDCDRVITLTLHGNLLDLRAAMYAAAALTEISGGVFYDPQGEQFATGRGVYELIRQDEESERERGRRAAEKDAAFTNDRCPHCSAPCPSYRKTCKACGRAVNGH
jgi:hypothetical protein